MVPPPCSLVSMGMGPLTLPLVHVALNLKCDPLAFFDVLPHVVMIS
jgi:hypothetical protein